MKKISGILTIEACIVILALILAISIIIITPIIFYENSVVENVLLLNTNRISYVLNYLDTDKSYEDNYIILSTGKRYDFNITPDYKIGAGKEEKEILESFIKEQINKKSFLDVDSLILELDFKNYVLYNNANLVLSVDYKAPEFIKAITRKDTITIKKQTKIQLVNNNELVNVVDLLFDLDKQYGITYEIKKLFNKIPKTLETINKLK